ncbi:RNA polymerase sigma factor [Streptomyces sp. NPDC092369]|uniref:RNA polymerase sigma factor n=1 Tax=Streptomyces sp. NPDC092369 TaxID=3366015 RepID=UPI003821086F
MITEANARPTCSDTPEPDLIARAQQGDTDAFGELYALHRPAVAAFVRQRVGNHRWRTEDITSETFLRAFRKLHTFRWTGKPLLSWLFTIARNIVADHYKASPTQRLIFTDEVDVLSDYKGRTAPPPDDEVFARLDTELLRIAMGRITADQRRVIACRFLREMTVEETAAALGMTEGAAKTSQYRAVRSLQRFMERPAA